MRRLATAFTLASALAATALAQAETKTLAGKDVAIYNLAGRLRAVAGSGTSVTVEITRVGPDASRLKIESGSLRNRETLRIIYPSDYVIYPDMRGNRVNMAVNDDGTFGDDDDRRYSDRVTIRRDGTGFEAHADLVVSVPKGQRITLNLGAGRVEITNVDGDVALDAGASDVDVSGSKGTLSLDTGSGRVGVRNVTGDVNIDAGSGGVTVEHVTGSFLSLESGSGSVEASDLDLKEFRADVGSGGIRVTGLKAPTVTVETGSGSASVEIQSAIERLTVESGSGGVTIRAPASLSAEIDATTGSGGFTSDFDIVSRHLGRRHVEGTIGDGKGRIRLESGSGSIRLLKL